MVKRIESSVEKNEDQSVDDKKRIIRDKLMGIEPLDYHANDKISPTVIDSPEDEFLRKEVETELEAQGFTRNKKGIWHNKEGRRPVAGSVEEMEEQLTGGLSPEDQERIIRERLTSEKPNETGTPDVSSLSDYEMDMMTRKVEQKLEAEGYVKNNKGVWEKK